MDNRLRMGLENRLELLQFILLCRYKLSAVFELSSKWTAVLAIKISSKTIWRSNRLVIKQSSDLTKISYNILVMNYINYIFRWCTLTINDL